MKYDGHESHILIGIFFLIVHQLYRNVKKKWLAEVGIRIEYLLLFPLVGFYRIFHAILSNSKIHEHCSH